MRKKFKKVNITPCPWHNNDKLGYIQFFEDADKRDAKGQRQIKCHFCGYYFWPDKFGVDPFSKLKSHE